MEPLSLLEKNINALLLRYDALEEKIKTLEHTTEEQREEIIRSHSEIAKLKRQYRQLQTAFSIAGQPEQKEKARQQINYLLQLVDKAIESLKN